MGILGSKKKKKKEEKSTTTTKTTTTSKPGVINFGNVHTGRKDKKKKYSKGGSVKGLPGGANC
jgi:hypothetical protein